MSSDSILDLSCCQLCPRACGINRLSGEKGFCRAPGVIQAARAGLLFCEEPCISGRGGSGAIFFTGCNLGCVFCQNVSISCGMSASVPGTVFKTISSAQLLDIFLSFEQQGASSISLITPSHFLPLLIPALEGARNHSLSIPIVYNTSSYEFPQTLRALDGLIDVYLPDLKFCSESLSLKWAGVSDYWLNATASIQEMVRQCPTPIFADGSSSLTSEDDADDPPMIKGVLVRHMVMPGQIEDSKKILSYLYKTYGNRIFISIMNQYTPMPQCSHDPLLSRSLTKKEYDEIVDFAILLGIENGFVQEGETISQSFIPVWDGSGLP